MSPGTGLQNIVLISARLILRGLGSQPRRRGAPQLAQLAWLTEVTGTKIGRWPVAEVRVKLSESPAFAGGRIDRGAPCYGEDNEYVYGKLLGMTKREIADLAAKGVF